MKGGQGHEPVGGDGESGSGDRPGVNEELIERARADEAEARCAVHEARIAELEQQLGAAREALDASERRRQIERALGESDTVDIETASLLTEAAVAQMDEPDVVIAVEELRRRKPFLFHGAGMGAGASRGIAMRPAEESAGDGADLGGLAERARQSGDRRALLQYLRQRRC